jgi:hypothetical protein
MAIRGQASLPLRDTCGRVRKGTGARGCLEAVIWLAEKLPGRGSRDPEVTGQANRPVLTLEHLRPGGIKWSDFRTLTQTSPNNVEVFQREALRYKM